MSQFGSEPLVARTAVLGTAFTRTSGDRQRRSSRSALERCQFVESLYLGVNLHGRTITVCALKPRKERLTADSSDKCDYRGLNTRALK